jgi:hypothetical protein
MPIWRLPPQPQQPTAKVILAAGGTTYNESLTDGIKGGETITAGMVYGISLTDGFKSGDNQGLAQVLGIVLTDGTKQGETLSVAQILGLALTDGTKQGDTLTPAQVLGILLLDGIKAGDTLAVAQVLGILLADGVKLSDLISLGSAIWNELLADGIKGGDALTPAQILNLLLADGVKMGDKGKLFTQTIQVAASADDCYRLRPADGNSFATGENFFLAGFDGVYYFTDYLGSAARFLNITIPPGSIITLAQLKLTCMIPNSLTTVRTRLRAERNINPATFSGRADFDARVWTDAFVNWDSIAAWLLDTEYASQDLTSCVQEVINLPGWVSGNPMVILWDDWESRSDHVTDTQRTAWSFDGSAAKAPKLYIEYTTPGLTNQLVANNSLTDGTKHGDTLINQVAFSNALSDGIKLGDLIAFWSIYNRLLSDGIKVGDTNVPQLAYNLSVLDGIKLSDILAYITTARSRRYGFTVPAETSTITTRPIGAGRYG